MVTGNTFNLCFRQWIAWYIISFFLSTIISYTLFWGAQ